MKTFIVRHKKTKIKREISAFSKQAVINQIRLKGEDHNDYQVKEKKNGEDNYG